VVPALASRIAVCAVLAGIGAALAAPAIAGADDDASSDAATSDTATSDTHPSAAQTAPTAAAPTAEVPGSDADTTHRDDPSDVVSTSGPTVTVRSSGGALTSAHSEEEAAAEEIATADEESAPAPSPEKTDGSSHHRSLRTSAVSSASTPSFSFGTPDADGAVSGAVSATQRTDEAPLFSGGGETPRGIVTMNSDGTFTFWPNQAAREAAAAADAASTGADRYSFTVTIDYRNGDVETIEVDLPVTPVGGTPPAEPQPEPPAASGGAVPEAPAVVVPPEPPPAYTTVTGTLGAPTDSAGEAEREASTAAPKPKPDNNSRPTRERDDPDTAMLLQGRPAAQGTPAAAPSTEIPGPLAPLLLPAVVVQLQVAFFAMAALLGNEGMMRGITGLAVPAAGGATGGGRVASVGSGSLKTVANSGGVGDRSRSWRLPGTQRLDAVTRSLPVRMAPYSPLLARIAIDGSSLRAMLGSAALALPVLGLLLGALVLRDTGASASPPGVALLAAVAMVGVFDALAGFFAVAVVVAGVAIAGNLGTAADLRTMLGLSVIWFAVPLIAGAARPLRRAAAQSVADWRSWIGDLVIATLIGAWAIQKMITALPALAGRPLPITAHATTVAVIVLGACVARIGLETIAARWYPTRLADVQPDAVPTPSAAQRITAAILRTGVLLFVASAFLGVHWQLWVGGVLFLLPLLLAIYEGRLPNSPFLARWRPRGIVKLVAMLLVGVGVAALVNRATEHSSTPALDAFVLLAIPGVIVAIIESFGRDGDLPEESWLQWFSGAGILTFGIWLVLFGM
jgi:hypothetical protein